MSAPPGWKDLLAPDEQIIWQGRPDVTWQMTLPQWIRFGFGIVFSAIALLWISTAMQAGGVFWAFGLIHLFAGLGVALHALAWDKFRRARTWYTLSNQRAFVATNLPFQGKVLKSYPITRNTILTFDDAPLASIGFAFEDVPLKRHTKLRMVGFERIQDGRAVYAMMRDMQGDLPKPELEP